MLQTVSVKLLTSTAQDAALVATMERFNAACNELGRIAHAEAIHSKRALHRRAYREIRERFGLQAQFAIEAIAKTSAAVASADRKRTYGQPRFSPRGGVPYDQRILSWRGTDRVSILTLGGRQHVALAIAPHFRARLQRRRHFAVLIRRASAFYLLVATVADEEPVRPVDDMLGVDLGIRNIAADSDGNLYSGLAIDRIRERLDRRRADLQRKKTRAARRKLRQLRGRQARFQANINHVISKVVVRRAKGTARGIGIEDLRHIHERTTVRRHQRARHLNWSFGQLRRFLEYKARLAGVLLLVVDPRDTSRTCPGCQWVDAASRRGGSFQCTSCGLAGPADVIAARNIALRATVDVMRPNAERLLGKVAVQAGTSDKPLLTQRLMTRSVPTAAAGPRA